MITNLKVNGFKTLTDFSLNFRPGLNILVGPNGSGKTNLVSYFEFLAHLMETDASEATSRVGGAGAVFRRVGSSYETHIHSRIQGVVARKKNRASPDRRTKNKSFLHYEFTFTLLFPDTRDSVIFESQRLRLKGSDEQAPPDFDTEDKCNIDLEASLSPDGEPIANVHSFDSSLFDVSFFLGSGKDPDSKSHLQQTITKMLAHNISLVNVLSKYSPDFWDMVRDVSTGQVYNIIPSRVKLPEDSAKPAGIARDGSGLAATLYAMQKSKQPEEFSMISFTRPRLRTFSPSAIDELKSYLQLVNESIADIDVSNDTFDNQLRVRFHVKNGDYSAIIPMTLMSDGTLKWVALITAALTSSSLFSIEEPENYLHPNMQSQIVNILREILFANASDRFTLMTTHSETLLNNCKPEELVIVSLVDGKTVARRCENAEEISDEIAQTGFGLGYYYITDSFASA